MKAAILAAPTLFEIHEMPDPSAPHDGLVIQVEACGICGSDLRRWREGPLPDGSPLIAGHEIAGAILQVGSQVTDYQVGERLGVAPDVHCGKCYYCQRGLFNLCDTLKLIGITPGYHGGFAGQMILTREILTNGIVHRLPDGMSFAGGALAEPCSSVLAAHHMAGSGLGDTVVIMGAGPIGCVHIAVAHSRGARVILSEPNVSRRKMAEAFQPDRIVDPTAEDLAAIVREETGGVGADVAVCANPVAATHAQAVDLVRKRGKVVLFGGLPKANPITALDANRIHYGEIQVIGSFSYHPTFHALALDLVHQKVIRAEKVITHTMSLDDVNTAFQTAASGEALKVILTTH